jgi:hypothetical protein
VIDALDECNPDERDNLLQVLENILEESSCLTKIFVSSRDDQGIVCQLEDYPNLKIDSNRNMHDIAFFVQIETQSLIKTRKLLRFSESKESLKEIIISQVTDGAKGM